MIKLWIRVQNISLKKWVLRTLKVSNYWIN